MYGFISIEKCDAAQIYFFDALKVLLFKAFVVNGFVLNDSLCRLHLRIVTLINKTNRCPVIALSATIFLTTFWKLPECSAVLHSSCIRKPQHGWWGYRKHAGE
jgi:hypothetical protein